VRLSGIALGGPRISPPVAATISTGQTVCVHLFGLREGTLSMLDPLFPPACLVHVGHFPVISSLPLGCGLLSLGRSSGIPRRPALSAADAASLVTPGPSLKTAPSVPVPGHPALSAIRWTPGRPGGHLRMPEPSMRNPMRSLSESISAEPRWEMWAFRPWLAGCPQRRWEVQ
jgi:hypothetical protein